MERLSRRRARARQRGRVAAVMVSMITIGAAIAFATTMMNAALDTGSEAASAAPEPVPIAAAGALEPAPAVATTTPAPQPAVETQTAEALTPSPLPEAVSSAALPYPAPSVPPRTFRRLDVDEKYVAITIDDGVPIDERMLDLFAEHDVRCTTFLLGQVAASRPDLVRRMHDLGFEVANHTYDHAWLTRQSDAEIRSQLRRSQESITAVTGTQAPYLRPPYGATDERVERIAAELGYQIVLWNSSFGDTSSKATASHSYRSVVDRLQPGDIILCHWGKETSYEAMKMLLPELERRGYTPVTVSELLAVANESSVEQ